MIKLVIKSIALVAWIILLAVIFLALKAYANTPEPTVIETPTIEITPTPTPTATPTPQKTSWIGKVSHYSEQGCLGCSETLTMANGERLDDTKPTIAFNHLPMNTRVLITNLDNGKSIEAVVTDTGGFERLGRIADLTLVVAGALETKTDISRVKIEKL